MSRLALKLEDIVKNYGKKEVLKGLSAEFEYGKIIAIIGENGCGKSTLFKILLNLARQTSGRVISQEQSIYGIVEEPEFYPNMTGRENLYCFAEGKNLESVNHYIDLLKMNDYIDKKVSKYSQGMKQRLAICCIMLRDGKIEIFDEPTNALDPLGIEIFKGILYAEKNKGKLILVSSHDLYFVESFIDEVYYMIDGKLIKRDKITLNKNNAIEYEIIVEDLENAVKYLKTKKIEHIVVNDKIRVELTEKKMQKLIADLLKFNVKQFYVKDGLAKEYIEVVKNEK